MPNVGKDFLISQRSALDAVAQVRLQQQVDGLKSAQDLKKTSSVDELAEDGGKARKDLEIKKSATQFEALLLQQMMKEMWNAVPKDGMLSGSREEELFRDMLNETLASSVAEQQSVGIKDIVMKEMQKRQSK
jgi:Rod binding domain-containing protein